MAEVLVQNLSDAKFLKRKWEKKLKGGKEKRNENEKEQARAICLQELNLPVYEASRQT